jgi:DNA excision repair protein ERCC-2
MDAGGKIRQGAAGDDARAHGLRDTVAGDLVRPSGETDDGGASYTVAVRTLCEFTAKRGDLDLRFTPSPSAQEGMAGHAFVRARRAAGYRSEISLGGEHAGAYGKLIVRGRADGYDTQKRQLEEIKTHRGPVDLIPANHRHLHWAQLKVYGALLCRKENLAGVGLALVYFDIDSQAETVLTEQADAAGLQAFFDDACERFGAWAQAELAHRAARDAALVRMAFPHPAFRTGQRELAETVYRAASGARCVLAQAPTGIGKTIATVFPTLKAMPVKGIDKLFFLAAKTSGRQLALDSLALLERSNLRILEMVARDKACEYPDRACNGESCPLARGFYDRLPAARVAALESGWLERAALREVALAHTVCPYYLSQDLARWSDVVVGDYNYYFDLNAMLHGLAQQNQWRVSVLVDEAHNMVERARKMYSAQLSMADFRFLRASAPAILKKDFDRLWRCWNGLKKAGVKPRRALGGTGGADDGDRKADAGAGARTGAGAGSFPGAASPPSAPPYEVLPALPEKFLAALRQACATVMESMTANPLAVDPALLRFYFDALHFTRLAELSGFDTGAVGAERTTGLAEASRQSKDAVDIGIITTAAAAMLPFDASLAALTDPPATARRRRRASESPATMDIPAPSGQDDTVETSPVAGHDAAASSIVDLTRQGADVALTIRNIVPAPFLGPRFRSAHSVVLFSATLTPAHYYRDLLGLPPDTVEKTVASPFLAEQLSVRVAHGISTRFGHRQASLAPIAGLMANQFMERPGNYLAFFSSFDYLQQVAAVFRQRHADIPVWEQERRMDEAQRLAFLERFCAGGRGIGFAVLGGVFGEGIDLPGDRLIGAFVATLGLPQWNAVNEQMRQRMQALFGAGHEYTYLYPGLQKVVQAAGRVIRGEQDRGALILIDDRFASSQVRGLLPEWWHVEDMEPSRQR